MYKECKSPRTRQRSQHMARTLIHMMQREHFSSITISALCAEAQVPRKSFYRYFETKEDVFHLLVDTLLSECIEYCSLGPLSEVTVNEDRLTLCFRFWLDHRQVFDAAQKSDMLSDVFSRMVHYYEIRFLSTDIAHESPDSMIRLLFSVSGMMSIILQWYSQNFRQSPEEMARLTMALLRQPLVAKSVTIVPFLGDCPRQ